MRNRDSMARTVIAAKLIGDEIKQAAQADRDELTRHLETEGIDGVSVKSDDGVKLGRVVFVEGTQRATVTDETAFLDWVKRHRPDQVRQIVDTQYRKAVLDAAKDDGVASDPETGGVIPGITVTDAAGYIKALPNPDAKKLMTQLLHGNRLLQLGTGTKPEPPAIDEPDWPGLDGSDGDPW